MRPELAALVALLTHDGVLDLSHAFRHRARWRLLRVLGLWVPSSRVVCRLVRFSLWPLRLVDLGLHVHVHILLGHLYRPLKLALVLRVD